MFVNLSMDDAVEKFVQQFRDKYKSFIFWKDPQSGKTEGCLAMAEMFYHDSVVILIQDKNSDNEKQNVGRARRKGFLVQSYMDKINLPYYLLTTVGQKKILSFMMEINNLESLEKHLSIVKKVPITLIIDEADKSRNTSQAGTKKGKKNTTVQVEDDDSSDDVTDSDEMPPLTRLLLRLKNLVKARENSRTVFVTATPMGVLAAEKEKWCVLYQEPFLNYVSPEKVRISNNMILENRCPTRSRWSGDVYDQFDNTFYSTLDHAIDALVALDSKDTSIKQVMLVSLEKQIDPQKDMGKYCRKVLDNMSDSSVTVIVRNGDTKKDDTLAEVIGRAPTNKVILIAGFMASRGVSFTDFSDKSNLFELVCQIHYTKPSDKLNSSYQAMRILGPARRTVSRPTMITNRMGIQDLQVNFRESYRIIREIAEQCENDTICVAAGNYNTARELTQSYNFRWLKQTNQRDKFIVSSPFPADALPIE